MTRKPYYKTNGAPKTLRKITLAELFMASFARLICPLEAKTRQVKYRAFFLLLLYTFANSPLLLFHHHGDDIVAYSKATACEKATYYSGKTDICKHKAHLAKVKEKCSLCDNHNLSVHIIVDAPVFYIDNPHYFKYALRKVVFYDTTTFETQTRGPPVV